MSLDCGTLNAFFPLALVQLFWFNFFYWLGCFTTFDVPLCARLGSTSHMEQFRSGLKGISWIAVLVPSDTSLYQQHLTLLYSLEEPSDCIHLQLQGLSWRSLSRSILHGYPVQSYAIPKHQRLIWWSHIYGKTHSSWTGPRSGENLVGAPSTACRHTLPTNPTCHTW